MVSLRCDILLVWRNTRILHINPEDVRVSEILVKAGGLLDIRVLDHLVIGRNRVVSMKERGLGFK